MLDKKEIYQKIQDVFPDIGEPGQDIHVEFDTKEQTWVVDLQDGHKHLKTYLDDGDAESCVTRDRCIGLGIMVSQLKDNLELM